MNETGIFLFFLVLNYCLVENPLGAINQNLLLITSTRLFYTLTVEKLSKPRREVVEATSRKCLGCVEKISRCYFKVVSYHFSIIGNRLIFCFYHKEVKANHVLLIINQLVNYYMAQQEVRITKYEVRSTNIFKSRSCFEQDGDFFWYQRVYRLVVDFFK